LRFGFNWLSYGNDDMANYCLGAKLYLNSGYFHVPPEAAVIHDQDASLLYWHFYVVDGIRQAAEELLAWAASVSHISTLQAFMPLILALHLALVAAAGALVLQNRKCRRAALLTCILLSVSASGILGAVYQLLAQVGGIT